MMYLDFLSAMVSKNRLKAIMQRAKNDRSVLRALPVYDNGTITLPAPGHFGPEER